MAESSIDKLLKSVQQMAGSIKSYVSGQLYFSGLHDTPTGYLSGYYVRANETGIEYIHPTGVAKELSDVVTDEIVQTLVTGKLMAFTGLYDTPTGYQSGYYLESTATGISYIDPIGLARKIPTIPNAYDFVPEDMEDGEIIKVGCDLYLSCDGVWKKVDLATEAPEVESLPGCVTNSLEAVEYAEYREQFLANNLNDNFTNGFLGNDDISDTIHDVCLFSSDSRSEVKIDETNYKWGMFSDTQTVNITATPGTASDGDIVFTHWSGESVVLGDKNSSQTTLLVDRDLSVTGYFVKYATPEPICISPLNKITSPNPTSESFGGAVAVDGHRMVIGAYGNDSAASNAGIAYVYELVDRNWTLQTTLIAPDAAPEKYFGAGVAIDGDRLMVSSWLDGGYGSIYVYELIMNTDTGEKEWTYQTKIMAPSTAYMQNFGRAMDLQGDQLVVGDQRYDYKDNGAVFVYVVNPVNGVWTLQQTIYSQQHNIRNGGDYGEWFGDSVSLDGDRLFIGAAYEDIFKNNGTVLYQAGAVYLYEKSPGGSWTFKTKITAPDAAAFDYFGYGVAVHGDRLMIGSSRKPTSNRGEVYVYQLVAGEWTYQNTKITAMDAANNDRFGESLSLDGDRLLVGVPYDRRPVDYAGSAYIYWLNCDPATVEESVNQYWVT